jgi:putrescine transport system substrate-binding protein
VIFDPETIAKFADCGVHMLDAPAEMIPAALNYLGLDPNSFETADDRTGGRASGLDPPLHPEVPLLRIHQRAGQWRHLPRHRLVRRRAAGARPRRRGRQRRDRRIRHSRRGRADVVRPDGDPDRRAASRGRARLPQLHHEAGIIAAASNYVYYANGNEASKPLLNEDVIGDPAIYPPDSTVDKLYTTDPYPPRVQRIVTRAWTRVKTGS